MSTLHYYTWSLGQYQSLTELSLLPGEYTALCCCIQHYSDYNQTQGPNTLP